MNILERLRGYNPPDRTIDEQRQIAVDISNAANEIESLQSRLDEANKELIETKALAGYSFNKQIRASNKVLREEMDIAAGYISMAGEGVLWDDAGRQTGELTAAERHEHARTAYSILIKALKEEG